MQIFNSFNALAAGQADCQSDMSTFNMEPEDRQKWLRFTDNDSAAWYRRRVELMRLLERDGDPFVQELLEATRGIESAFSDAMKVFAKYRV